MIYFDNAATSRFKPEGVLKAVLESLQNSANPGRSGHSDAIAASLILHNTRKKILKYVGAENYQVVFTKNCTEALNLAIFGTLRQGHVITTMLEHNSVLRPLKFLESQGKIRLTILSPDIDGQITSKSISKVIREDTYLLAITMMSNVTGVAPNISEIGELALNRGILLLSDSAQAIGHIPINMQKMGIDLLAAPGHKALHAPQGVGFLVLNNKIKLKPLLYGGTGTDSANLLPPILLPESFESGTVNTPAIHGLLKALEWTMSHSADIDAKLSHISDYINNQLCTVKGVKIYSAPHSSLITFAIAGVSSSKVADILSERYNIAVRGGLHCAPLIHGWLNTSDTGLVRISIGYNNTLAEAKKLVTAVRALAD